MLAYLRMRHKDPYKGYVLCGIVRSLCYLCGALIPSYLSDTLISLGTSALCSSPVYARALSAPRQNRRPQRAHGQRLLRAAGA